MTGPLTDDLQEYLDMTREDVDLIRRLDPNNLLGLA